MRDSLIDKSKCVQGHDEERKKNDDILKEKCVL